MAETTTIQLSRAKGSTRPSGVVVVDRSSPWGNPARVGYFRRPGTFWIQSARDEVYTERLDQAAAVAMFEEWVTTSDGENATWIRDHVHELAGKTLGCWCSQDGPCHAKVLARLADEAVAGG